MLIGPVLWGMRKLEIHRNGIGSDFNSSFTQILPQGENTFCIVSADIPFPDSNSLR